MSTDREERLVAEEAGRVDKVSSAIVPRSVFSQEGTEVLVNGKGVKKSFKVKEGDEIIIRWREEVFEGLEGEDIPLDVIYEDEAILVINKPSGMVVHPGAGNWNHTLVNALIYRYGSDFSTRAEEDEEDEESLLRPGIVHRLDRDTSGVMVVAKTAEAHRKLAEQFALHSNEKVYICIAKGLFEKKRGTIKTNLIRDPKNRKAFTTTDKEDRGKTAITHYTVLRQTHDYAFVRVSIETGRTHQIRVHLKSINHPILGDPVYSRPDKRFPNCRLCLHSFSLTFDHPTTGERMTFRAKLPEDMKAVLKELGFQLDPASQQVMVEHLLDSGL